MDVDLKWLQGQVRIVQVIESLQVWRAHADDKKPYHGLGLRPHNALWKLVVHCGVPYDEARRMVDG